MDRPRFFKYYGNYANSNYGLHCLAFEDSEGNIFYYSYQTLVAFYVAKHRRKFCIKNYWSTTTGKHLNAIEPDHALRCSKEDFEKLYRLTFSSQEQEVLNEKK